MSVIVINSVDGTELGKAICPAVYAASKRAKDGSETETASFDVPKKVVHDIHVVVSEFIETLHVPVNVSVTVSLGKSKIPKMSRINVKFVNATPHSAKEPSEPTFADAVVSALMEEFSTGLRISNPEDDATGGPAPLPSPVEKEKEWTETEITAYEQETGEHRDSMPSKEEYIKYTVSKLPVVQDDDV